MKITRDYLRQVLQQGLNEALDEESKLSFHDQFMGPEYLAKLSKKVNAAYKDIPKDKLAKLDKVAPFDPRSMPSEKRAKAAIAMGLDLYGQALLNWSRTRVDLMDGKTDQEVAEIEKIMQKLLGNAVPGTPDGVNESRSMKITREHLKHIIAEEISLIINEAEGDEPVDPVEDMVRTRNKVEKVGDFIASNLVNYVLTVEAINRAFESYPVLGTVDQVIEDLVDLVTGGEDVVDNTGAALMDKVRRLAAGIRVYTSAKWQAMFVEWSKELLSDLMNTQAEIMDTGDPAGDPNFPNQLKDIRDDAYEDLGKRTEEMLQQDL